MDTNTKVVRLTFCGGAGSVTGANFLLEAAGLRILVDCGMMQGSRFAEEENRKPFPYDPASIDFLLVTHAHIDHIGRIPKLVADGFKGKIISTPATHALAGLMFEDALKLIEEECRTTGTLPLYEHKDVSAALALWGDVPYHQTVELGKGVSVYVKDAGHILGSAMYEISLGNSPLEKGALPSSAGGMSTTPALPPSPKATDGRGADSGTPFTPQPPQAVPFTKGDGDGERYRQIKIVFTGDLGNSPTPILKDTEAITDADYIVMESVYGDRNHEDRHSRRLRLHDVMQETLRRKGTLIIPTFSLEKTQVLLYEINELVESGRLPRVPVFLDSPLAIAVTRVYKAMPGDFNDAARKDVAGGDDIFNFPLLKLVTHSEESKAILRVPVPKIILAGSGMSNGGRILHHEINYLPGRENTILFTGYQAAGTLGRQIQDGLKEVIINGQKIPVRARVETISGYSSHKDSDHLIQFVETAAAGGTLKKVFLCMGEPKAASFLAQRLRDYVGVEASVPEAGESVELN